MNTPRNEKPTLRRAGALLAAVGVAALVAGCGSSNGSQSTITVGNQNPEDNKLVTQTATTQTSTTPSSSSTKTPTSGPLSKKPVITAQCTKPVTKLVTRELITGTGAEAKKGSTVTVNYVGVLCQEIGKEFDSSWRRNEPFTFTIGSGGVIKGWEEGVIGMKVGGRRELIIPAGEAYGSKGSGTIPPNEPLVFVVDLLKA